MIRDELQYASAVARLNNQHLQLIGKREQLRLAGVSEEKVDRLIGHLTSSCQQLEEEIAVFERRTARTWVPAI